MQVIRETQENIYGIKKLFDIFTQKTDRPTMEELIGNLRKYSPVSDRIRKLQFHVVASCKTHEMTESELLPRSNALNV